MKTDPEIRQKVQLSELTLELPKDYTSIDCPSCETSVPADNININDKIAKCHTCDVVFPFHEIIANFTHTDTPMDQEVFRPEGIDIFRYKDDLEFTVKQPTTDFDIIFLTLPFYAFLFTTIYVVGDNIIFLWPAIITWGLSIYGIFNWFNRSKHNIRITIDDQKLHLIWQPKKFNKEQVYDIKDIDQIYVKPLASNHCSLYMIVNSLNGQKHVKLINILKSKSKARYLEQEIESHLGIQNRVVPEAS